VAGIKTQKKYSHLQQIKLHETICKQSLKPMQYTASPGQNMFDRLTRFFAGFFFASGLATNGTCHPFTGAGGKLRWHTVRHF